MRHFGPEDQRLWKDVTEELMSDEEDSLNEPGVWVARPPRFRAQRLTQLCYHLDANSKHGTKANRVYGPPSDRLPSAEAQLLPPELYNPNFQEEEDEGDRNRNTHFAVYDTNSSLLILLLRHFQFYLRISFQIYLLLFNSIIYSKLI